LIENKIWDDKKKSTNGKQMNKKNRKKLNDKEDIRGKYHKICQHFGLPFDFALDKTP